MVEMPSRLWWPHEPFDESFAWHSSIGAKRAKTARVAVVGLARNCADRLAQNLKQAENLFDQFLGWQLHIESNDCEDDTLSVLHDFCAERPNATFHYQILGRQHCPNEFAGRRTIALAEYRDACQRWVKACAKDADYVVVIDFDQWGGWNDQGILNSLGWMLELQGAYGMASVSLFQWDFGNGPQWAHYDQWALRGLGQPNCYWDTYQNGYSGWGYSWLPPVGSPPALVSSAFGGLCLYRAAAYLAGTYDGTSDCEHVAFHQSIAKATGQHLFVNPSQRTLMTWLESCAETPAPSA